MNNPAKNARPNIPFVWQASACHCIHAAARALLALAAAVPALLWVYTLDLLLGW